MSVDTTTIILHENTFFYVATIQNAEELTDAHDSAGIFHQDWKDKKVSQVKEDATRNRRITQNIEQAYIYAEACEQDHINMMGFPSEYGILLVSL